jgi:hypothetical protein
MGRQKQGERDEREGRYWAEGRGFPEEPDGQRPLSEKVGEALCGARRRRSRNASCLKE